MAGGWTGGHVFPIKSLLEYVEEHKVFSNEISAIFWFWSDDSLEESVFKKINQTRNGPKISFIRILSGKFRRETFLSSHLKNFRDFRLFLFGILQSLRYLKKHKIDIIFCKGWYVALPVVVAGRILRKKIVVHESDTRPWLVNKLASKMANKVFTWFDDVLPGAETIGQIISDDLIFNWNFKDIPNIKEVFDQEDKNKTRILVFWWSQWSQRLYQSLIRAIQTDKTLQTEFIFFVVLWLLNKDLAKEFEWFENIHVFEFVSQKEMWALCASCDIAITRAGTTSLAEQKMYDMKLFIVPIAWTHAQYQNAERYQTNHWDVFLDQRHEDFINKLVLELKKHKEFKKELKHNNKTEIIHAAKDKVWEALLDVAL